MPSAPTARTPLSTKIVLFVALVTGPMAYVAGLRSGRIHELMSAMPSGAQRIAFVREEPCGDKPCQTIWIGTTREDAVRVASLASGVERCDEIAWASDGYRVGFVINGYQLRIFDGVNRTAVRDVNLIEPDGAPTSHLVRGVTFSQNGAAVTFDECPRGRSGCKSGLAAVR
ncbi:MAG: hypothetical protein ABI818_11575 [Acidobacteriota bacterium]